MGGKKKKKEDLDKQSIKFLSSMPAGERSNYLSLVTNPLRPLTAFSVQVLHHGKGSTFGARVPHRTV